MKQFLLFVFSFFVFGISAQAQTPPSTCIDSSLICPTCPCTMIYLPVCACDGQVYNNACLAQNAGNTSWVSYVSGQPCVASNPCAYTFTVSTTDASSYTATDGSISVSVTAGGSGPLTYGPWTYNGNVVAGSSSAMNGAPG
jgi:hypothetical protein